MGVCARGRGGGGVEERVVVASGGEAGGAILRLELLHFNHRISKGPISSVGLGLLILGENNQ